MNSNAYSDNLATKTIVLFVTILMVFIVFQIIRVENLFVFLLLPILLDAGHIFLSIYYQYKSKQFNYFYVFKIIMSIAIGASLIYWGEPTFNRWIVYAFGSWHILNGEKFTLRNTYQYSEWEVLLPVSIYTYLTYLKYYNVEVHESALYIFSILIVSYSFWIFKKKSFTMISSYFLFFSLLNFIALLFYEKVSLLLIVIFYLYFHYISWYVYSAKKSFDLKSYIKTTSIVNIFFFALLMFFIFIPQREALAKYLAESFFIPGWLIFHLVSTIRPLR